MKYFWRIHEVYVYFSLHGCEYLYCAQTYSTRVWEDTLPCMRTYVLLDYTYIYLQTSIFLVSGILVLRVHCTFHPSLFGQLSSVWSLVYLSVLHLLNPIAIHRSLGMDIQVSNTMLAYDFCIQDVLFSSLHIRNYSICW